MTNIPAAAFIVHSPGAAKTATGLPEERCVRTAESRETLPKGTITIDADDCYAVADGNGGFGAIGLDGTYPGTESVILPAYIIAGPGHPVLVPGGGAVLESQADVDQVFSEFLAIDANGGLFMWDDTWENFGTFAWESVGHTGKASPVFPVTAWR